MHALRYLQPKTGFREVFAYDNITYIVAGALVQAVSGETWEHFVEHHIFAPLGMTDSRTFYDPTAAECRRAAWAHRWSDPRHGQRKGS